MTVKNKQITKRNRNFKSFWIWKYSEYSVSVEHHPLWFYQPSSEHKPLEYTLVLSILFAVYSSWQQR